MDEGKFHQPNNIIIDMKHITIFHYKLDHGGIDRVTALLANGFSKRGYHVTLLLFCSGGNGEDVYLDKIYPSKNDRLNIVYLGKSKSSRTKDLLRLLPHAIKYVKNQPSDYLLSSCNHMNWITAITAYFSKSTAKVIFKTTNPIIRHSDRGIYAALRKWGYQKAFEFADMILTLSDNESEQLKRAFPTASTKFNSVINPYVTDEMLQTPKIKPIIHNIPAKRKIILSIGRFEPQKNIALLIQSFAKLNGAVKGNCQLILLGDGVLRPEYEALIRKLGLEDNVSMPGFIGDVTPYLHAADLYMMTSTYEGLPAVILEALAANCPLLTTDCFLAAREIIEPLENCAILKRNDPQYIAHMMEKTLQTPHNKIINDLRIAAQKYSIENGISDHIQKLQC